MTVVMVMDVVDMAEVLILLLVFLLQLYFLHSIIHSLSDSTKLQGTHTNKGVYEHS